jgi:hypothetical protein
MEVKGSRPQDEDHETIQHNTTDRGGQRFQPEYTRLGRGCTSSRALSGTVRADSKRASQGFYIQASQARSRTTSIIPAQLGAQPSIRDMKVLNNSTKAGITRARYADRPKRGRAEHHISCIKTTTLRTHARLWSTVEIRSRSQLSRCTGLSRLKA